MNFGISLTIGLFIAIYCIQFIGNIMFLIINPEDFDSKLQFWLNFIPLYPIITICIKRLKTLN